MAKHGLAADNLLAVQLVTAEGDIPRQTPPPTPICFWRFAAVAGPSHYNSKP